MTGTYRLQDYADDTIAFLRHHRQEPAHLFDHSLGGIVALLVAAQYPDGVCAVVAGDAPLSGQSWQATLHAGRDRGSAWRDLAGGQQPLAELNYAEMTAPGYAIERVLPSIQCPVLLLQVNPTAGGLMTAQEVVLALPLLAPACSLTGHQSCAPQ